MDKLIYEEQMYLKNSDTDHLDRVKPQGILGLFEDIAGRHADILNIGYDTVKEKGLAWVVVRQKFEIVKNPSFNDKVVVKTWPHPKGRIDFDRDYLVETLSGDVLFKGSSKWILMNISDRTISRKNDINYDGKFYNNAIYDKINKINKPLGNFLQISTHEVCLNDIDHNGHMNNIRYLEMIYNSFSYDEKFGKTFTIEYMHESHYLDKLELLKYEEENATYFLITGNGIDRVLVKMED